MAHNDSMTCGCAESTNATCAPNTNGATRAAQNARTTFRPAVDVLDGEDAYRIVADLPGSSAENVSITFEDGVLTLDAQVPERTVPNAEALRKEYGVGAFHRRFRVHGEVAPEAISAAYAQGVLTVTLPKSSRSQSRRVPVNAN